MSQDSPGKWENHENIENHYPGERTLTLCKVISHLHYITDFPVLVLKPSPHSYPWSLAPLRSILVSVRGILCATSSRQAPLLSPPQIMVYFSSPFCPLPSLPSLSSTFLFNPKDYLSGKNLSLGNVLRTCFPSDKWILRKP